MTSPLSKTTVSNSAYYEVSYSGLERQYHKYQALRRAVMLGIERVLSNEPMNSPLSSAARDLKSWVQGPRGFCCEHMPWRVLIGREYYRMFVYVLREGETDSGMAAYHSIRRYGRWV